MNKLQGLNNAVFAGTLLVLAAGMVRDPQPIMQRPAIVWGFVLFLFLMRLKIFMDDQAYFTDPDTQTPHFRVGLVFGVASWLAWALAAWTVNTPSDSYFCAGIALSISTIWIVAVALRSGAYKEQYYWIASNAILLVLLWSASRVLQRSDDYTVLLLLVIAVIVVIADFVASKSTLDA